jgi:uncharacterized membrane protein YedE/YeeE
VALASRVSIVVLAAAMALRQMGLANEIINSAFVILFGAIGVAVALAFGLGGREAAGKALDQFTAMRGLQAGTRGQSPEAPAKRKKAAASTFPAGGIVPNTSTPSDHTPVSTN